MTQKFTIQNLLQYYPKYEEGMDLNKDIVRNIQNAQMTFVMLRTNYEAKRFMFRKIKYRDQYLAKTLFKRTFLFIFLLINLAY